jgi:hypothetical protein
MLPVSVSHIVDVYTTQAELSAVVSEAERRAIFVKRRKCVAADLVKYKLSYEQRDGLTSCEGRGAFGPTCFPNHCTTRAYLPGDVYIRAVRHSASVDYSQCQCNP